jgi:hypothetical protein
MGKHTYVVTSEWKTSQFLVGVCSSATAAFDVISRYGFLGRVPNWSYQIEWSVLSLADEIGYDIFSSKGKIVKQAMVRRVPTNKILVPRENHWLGGGVEE